MVRHNGVWGSGGVSSNHNDRIVLVKKKRKPRRRVFRFLFVKDTLVLVCDNYFDDIDLQSACYTLGFKNGSNLQTHFNRNLYWTESEIPILMDNMDCGSSTADFLSCGYSDLNCDHRENVLITCEDSSKLFLDNYTKPLRITKR